MLLRLRSNYVIPLDEFLRAMHEIFPILEGTTFASPDASCALGSNLISDNDDFDELFKFVTDSCSTTTQARVANWLPVVPEFD